MDTKVADGDVILSVIIPTYNRLNLIKFALDSLAGTHHPGIKHEIIVVDDGSTDGTDIFIEQQYPYIILLKNKGRGAPAARNNGLAAARGKYVMYLDSDDLVGDDYFRQKLAMLEEQPGLTACYGRYDFFESDGPFNVTDIIFRHKYPLIFSADEQQKHLLNYLEGNFLPSHTIIWRKDILLHCGGHDEALTINQDVDLFVRAIFNGLKIAALQDDTKVYIRQHALDIRVGDPKNANEKWVQILALRKSIFADLAKYGYNDKRYFRAMSNYLFARWKELRHSAPDLAVKYLTFAKEVYWPVEIKGNPIYRLLSKVVGPVSAVKLKYLLLRRD